MDANELYKQMMQWMGHLKVGPEWAKIFGVQVLSGDGWNHIRKSYQDDKIDILTFFEAMQHSTQDFGGPTNKRPLIPLVRYSCGCIGLEPNEEGKALMFMSCENDEFNNTDLSLCQQDTEAKTFTVVSLELAEKVAEELTGLYWDGVKFRELASIVSTKPMANQRVRINPND